MFLLYKTHFICSFSNMYIVAFSSFFYQECNFGSFGKNCSKKCSGHCLDDEVCNHIDGACTGGCQDGYIGIICNKSKILLISNF